RPASGRWGCRLDHQRFPSGAARAISVALELSLSPDTPPVTIAEKLRLPAPHRWPGTAAILRRAQRLVRTHAFRLAGLYFAVFVLSVLGVLFFVYWTSADFVERQTEATLDAEITGLAEQYAQRGLSG